MHPAKTLRNDQLRQSSTDRFIPRPSEHLFRAGIPCGDVPVTVHFEMRGEVIDVSASVWRFGRHFYNWVRLKLRSQCMYPQFLTQMNQVSAETGLLPEAYS